MKNKSTEFTILIERDEDNVYVGSVIEIPGCHSQAKTIPILMKRLKEAIELCQETAADISPMRFVGLQELIVN